jgi:hypothetical protein
MVEPSGIVCSPSGVPASVGSDGAGSGAGSVEVSVGVSAGACDFPPQAATITSVTNVPINHRELDCDMEFSSWLPVHKALSVERNVCTSPRLLELRAIRSAHLELGTRPLGRE